MAHELTTRKNGFVEFAYAASEGKGWHGLGQQVADDATLQQWIEASGMDWKVLRSQIRYGKIQADKRGGPDWLVTAREVERYRAEHRRA